MMSLLRVIAALVLLAPFGTRMCAASPNAERYGFETGSAAVTLHGARLRAGLSGTALEVRGKDYASLRLRRALELSSGTLSMWVKPLWALGDDDNHVLLSGEWEGAPGGYLVLSQGFYNKKSKRDLYFVLHNKLISCASGHQLEPGRWNHVIVTWAVGENVVCKIFVDGAKVAGNSKKSPGRAFEDGKVTSFLLGSDRAAVAKSRRRGDYLIEGLTLTGEVTNEDRAWNNFVRAGREDKVSDEAPVRYAWAQEWLTAGEGASDGLDPQKEKRYIFDPDIRWARSKRETDDILAWVKQAGFNVFVATAWQGIGVRYLHPDDSIPIEERVHHRLKRGDDPLAYLIEAAHREGVEVYAWFNIVQRRVDILPQFYDEGTPDRAFNVHDPAFRDFMVSLVLDVARRYDVDGINLDHIRAMGICRNSQCAESYARATGGTLAIDALSWRVSESARRRIGSWNYTAVTDIVQRVSAGLKKIRPDAELAVDAHPLHDGLMMQGQDSVRWANAGYIDRIFNMDYHTVPDFDLATRVLAALDDESKLTELFGTYEKTADGVTGRDPALLETYVRVSRRLLPHGGVAFYHRKQLNDRQVEHLRSTVFHHKLGRPTP